MVVNTEYLTAALEIFVVQALASRQQFGILTEAELVQRPY